jgi:DUF1680 family protein
MVPTWTYVKGQDGLYVNLFIGSTVKVQKVAGTDIEMVQKTDYPWSGKVSIKVNPEASKEFSLYVRVPNRTTSELYPTTPEVSGLNSLSVNGQKENPKIQNGYVAIHRTWKAGDTVELELPMQVQKIKASEHILADRGKVALRYGPLLYSLERADQDLSQSFNPDAPLTTEWKGDLLGGVTVIKGKFADGAEMTAVPNYARDNRGSQSGPRAGAAGESGIDYSGGASVGTTGSGNAATNSTARTGTGGGRRGRFGGALVSVVWAKSEPNTQSAVQSP